MIIYELLTQLAQLTPPDVAPLPQATKVVDNSTIQKILTLVFVAIGAVAVMMVVIGGIKYSASQGDPQAVSKAKGTILYAIIGLVICIMATVIVGFVFGRVA
jgi:ABC-type Fe3+ transport system permease subunit